MGAVDEVVYLLEEAFAGVGIERTGESQSLLGNLLSVRPEEWRALPAGAGRTIESVALHVGACTGMYDDHAFGSARLDWDDAAVQPWAVGAAPMEEAISWLRSAHVKLMEHVRVLSDEDLTAPRASNWGEMRETRWLLSMLIQHDVYHAGEINHIRALLRGDDAWQWS
jgi:uncharacterized damage-inducible protein DinB